MVYSPTPVRLAIMTDAPSLPRSATFFAWNMFSMFFGDGVRLPIRGVQVGSKINLMLSINHSQGIDDTFLKHRDVNALVRLNPHEEEFHQGLVHLLLGGVVQDIDHLFYFRNGKNGGPFNIVQDV